MSKCKDCGDDWSKHVPIGFCTQDGSGFDQCGCDSLPEGHYFTVDSLAAAMRATNGQLNGSYDTIATAIIKAAKEASVNWCTNCGQPLTTWACGPGHAALRVRRGFEWDGVEPWAAKEAGRE